MEKASSGDSDFSDNEKLLSFDDKTFQDHLIRIVGLPIVFIVILLSGFYLQGTYFDKLRTEARKITLAKISVLQLDKKFSEIETALRGFILSGNVELQKKIQSKVSGIDPITDQAFEHLVGDVDNSKRLRDLMKLFENFRVHVSQSMEVYGRKDRVETKNYLLESDHSYQQLKKATSSFFDHLELETLRLDHEQIRLSQLSSVVEFIATLILAFFIVFVMLRQLKSLTSSYRNLIKKNFENMGKLKESVRTKDLFLANMSHEIRTPLGAILGFSDLLIKDPSLDSEARSHSSFIKRNSEHLLGLVDDLFDVSRLVADKLDLHFETVNLVEFIEDIENYFQSKLHDKKINLEVTLDTRIPREVESDPVRLKQIVTNLVGNAVKFSSINSKVKLILSFSSGRLQIDVIDNGIGIDPSLQDKIFEAFTQVEEDYSRNYGGAGLGLSISKKLAIALQGDLKLVSSRPKVGSHFRLSVPVKSSSLEFLDKKFRDAGGSSQSTPRPGPKKIFDFSKQKILLAEDSHENQILFKIFLESAQTNLEVVDNGSDAVRKALSEEFDAILMDIQMPGLDGYEAVNILRGSKYNKPIIALTAHSMKGEREKCLEAGFSDYLSKPVTQQKLLTTLSKNLFPS